MFIYRSIVRIQRWETFHIYARFLTDLLRRKCNIFNSRAFQVYCRLINDDGLILASNQKDNEVRREWIRSNLYLSHKSYFLVTKLSFSRQQTGILLLQNIFLCHTTFFWLSDHSVNCLYCDVIIKRVVNLIYRNSNQIVAFSSLYFSISSRLENSLAFQREQFWSISSITRSLKSTFLHILSVFQNRDCIGYKFEISPKVSWTLPHPTCWLGRVAVIVLSLFSLFPHWLFHIVTNLCTRCLFQPSASD